MSPMGTLVLGTNSKPPEKVSPSLSSSTSLPACPANDRTLNNNNNDHPLLKLMSVSLLNENSLTLNLHHGLALTLGKNSKAAKSMKENEQNRNGICRPADSTSHDEYKERRIRSTEEDESDRSVSPSLESQNSRRSGTPETNLETGNRRNLDQDRDSDDEEDEVLSIGRDDDQGMVIDCDSSTALSDCEESRVDVSTREGKRRMSELEHEMRSPSESGSGGGRTPNSSPCSSSASASNVNMFSPSAYSDFHVHQHHKDIPRHNYSATQPHSHVNLLQAPITGHTSLPFSITEAIMMKSHQHRQQNLHQHLQQHQQNLQQQQSFQQQQASLLFSIANILRPDFGLGGSHNNSSHLKPTSLKNRHSAPEKRSGASSKPARPHGLNPIDLSRPSLVHAKNHGNKIRQNGSAIHNNNNHHQSYKSSESHSRQKHNGGSSSSKKSHKSSGLPSLPLPPIKAAAKAAATTTTPKSPGSGSGDSSGAASSLPDRSNPWPAWVYCTRYSDRPSSGPRTRRSRTTKKEKEIDEKRPRTAFTSEQLARLKREFDENRYLTEKRRQDLARELRLHENQIKIWFQNKRAKLKKSSGQRGGLALQLMAQGLYNHSTIPARGDGDGDDDDGDYDSD